MIARAFGARAAGLLERGALDGVAFRALGRVWARAARIERPLALPRNARVVGVGGPTLGGSYKTPLTLALAVALAMRGESVAVVAHAYRGLRGPARRIVPSDLASTVGDDAAYLARVLDGHGVPVFSGASREDVVRLAARAASVVVVDALLQARPERLALSLLSVDAETPWGGGACPPVGDLRASPDALARATDALVAVTAEEALPASSRAVLLRVGKPLFIARSLVTAVTLDGLSPVALDELRSARVGLILAVARPERVVRDLSRLGIQPVVTRSFADHSRPRIEEGSASAARVDVWLTTEKCATKLPLGIGGVPAPAARYATAPPVLASLGRARVVVLRHRLELEPALVARVAALG